MKFIRFSSMSFKQSSKRTMNVDKASTIGVGAAQYCEGLNSTRTKCARGTL